MRSFAYERPATLPDAVALLDRHGAGARVLAGGTDLIIRLRDGTCRATLIVDVKRIPELLPKIEVADELLRIGAGTVMADIASDVRVGRHFPALAEAAAVVGSVQIRNRATLAGNVCNASPAADTLPPLLIYGASVVAMGPAGLRRIALDDLLARSGTTTLRRGEVVTAIELPLPIGRVGATHVRRTRRSGHDLASVTLAVAIDDAGVTRLAYGSVGPRPLLVVDHTGAFADPHAPEAALQEVFDSMFAEARPSPRSMRAGPEYRLAMLRVLARRARQAALDRLWES